MVSQLGLLVLGKLPPPEMIDLAQSMERWGYHSLWHSNHAFDRDVYVDLATCAAHTSQLRLAAGLVNPFTRHPAITAAAAASLDEVSGGRTLLGFGAGNTGFGRLGFTRPHLLRRLREAIILMRQLWAGETVDFHGEGVIATGGRLAHPPRQIPIVIGTRGRHIYELAGELADGVIISTYAHPAGIKWAKERISEGATRAGRNPDEIELWLRPDLAIASDRQAARNAVKGMVLGSIRSNFPALDFLRPLAVEVPSALRDALSSDPASASPDLISDELVDTLAIAGTPNEVAAKLTELAPLVGGRILACGWPVQGQSVLELAQELATASGVRPLAGQSA